MSGGRAGSDEPLVSPTNSELIRRLRRIEGQVRGLQRMIEEGRACSEILVQLAALREALNKVGVTMIARQMETCFREESEAVGETGDRSKQLKEAVEMFLRFS